MLLEFSVYRQVNSDSLHQFPFVGVSRLTSRIINIHEQCIWISEGSDTLFFEPDYRPSLKKIRCNLSQIDELVKAYIGPNDFGIVVRFNEEKHITLTYQSPTNERSKDYDIFIGYPDERAQELIEKLYPLMEGLKESVFSLN